VPVGELYGMCLHSGLLRAMAPFQGDGVRRHEFPVFKENLPRWVAQHRGKYVPIIVGDPAYDRRPASIPPTPQFLSLSTSPEKGVRPLVVKCSARSVPPRAPSDVPSYRTISARRCFPSAGGTRRVPRILPLPAPAGIRRLRVGSTGWPAAARGNDSDRRDSE
jgi:hypothetical protein